MLPEAELALDTQCQLGEGPVWWAGSLWFVDIEGRALISYATSVGMFEKFSVPGRIGFAVPSEEHGWLIAQDGGIVSFRPGEGEPVRLSDIEAADLGTRMNDGKCDPTGRLYAGTMHLSANEGAGALYRFGADGSATMVVDDVTISNGLAWHEASGSMYYIDTATGRVDRFDWDRETGKISSRSPVATLENGSPDGMCIDRDGKLWVAMWGGSRVACVDPEAGEEVDAIPLPCPNVTSCCFGGNNLDELWITTARIGMDEAGLREHPHAGGLFVAKPGSRGLMTVPMKNP